MIALVVPLLALAGCSVRADREPSPASPAATTAPPSPSPAPSSPSPSSPSSASSPSQSPPPSPTPTATPTEVAGTEVLADGLSTPWGLARLPDGSHLVSLRDEARVIHVSPGGSVRPVPGTGQEGRVAGVRAEGEGGLLGIALAPDDPRTLYAYLTGEDDNRVVAMTYDGKRLGPLRLLLRGIPKARIHNGGRLAFGPDGHLYVATGDAGDGERSQDRSSLGGKILRITREGRPAPGNPYPGSPVWSLGHRNVQGLGWDGEGRLYASEFGQNTYDELNLVVPGRNYGWPAVEGMGDAGDRARGFTAPLRVWGTSEASPSGLAVGLGAVWMAALRGQRLWRVPITGPGTVGEPVALLRERHGRLRAVEVQPDGTLVLLTDNASRLGGDGSDQVLRVRLR